MKVEVGTKINGTPALIYVNDIPHEVTDRVDYIDHKGRHVTEYTATPLARDTSNTNWLNYDTQRDT